MTKAPYTLGLAAAPLLAIALTVAGTPAQAAGGWGIDNKGTVVRNSYGECWKSGSHDPNAAVPPECGGAPVDGDADQDGVPDSKDLCPGTPLGAKVDANGCEIMAKIVLPNFLFATGSAELSMEAHAVLNDAAAKIQRNHTVKSVVVTGHTDSVGSDASNMALSERRASAVRSYLIGKGVSAGMITAVGKGESQPVADNATAEGRAKNRRVEIDIQ